MAGAVLPQRRLSVGAKGVGQGQCHYELIEILDRGGMGELFLAEVTGPSIAPDGKHRVVLKRLLADLLDNDTYVAMFLAEAQVMSQLNHPNIVRVFDTPIVDGTQCLAMEYVQGGNVEKILTRALARGSAIPPRHALKIMSLVLAGLEYAHNYHLEDGTPLNLVHRDVTPGNILASFDGDVKLTDFGIAKSRMSVVTTTVGIVKGKASYLAPKQILGEAATSRSDLYSAACVTLEMLTGRPVFDRGSIPKTLYAIVHGERPALETQLSFHSPLLTQVLDRALRVDAAERLTSAREFSEGLDAAARLLGAPVTSAELGAYVRDLFGQAPSNSPGGSSSDPSTPTSAVDEALAVVYWLQSRQEKNRAGRRESEIGASDLAGSQRRKAEKPVTRAARTFLPWIVVFSLGGIAGTGIMLVGRAGRHQEGTESASGTEDEPEVELGAELGVEPSVDSDLGEAKETAEIAETAEIDILRPRGARVRIDGVLLREKTPIRRLLVKPGKHHMQILRGRSKKELVFSLGPGEHLELSARVTKRRKEKLR